MIYRVEVGAFPRTEKRQRKQPKIERSAAWLIIADREEEARQVVIDNHFDAAYDCRILSVTNISHDRKAIQHQGGADKRFTNQDRRPNE